MNWDHDIQCSTELVLILLHHYAATAGSKFRLFYLLHWIKDAFKWRSKAVEFHRIFLMRSLLLFEDGRI